MATRFLDSCQLESDPARLYATGGGARSYVAGKGRFGVPGLLASTDHNGIPLMTDHPNTILVNVAIANVSSSSTGPLLGFVDTVGGLDQIQAFFSVGGILAFARGSNGVLGGGTVLGQAVGAYITDVINQFEFKVFINNTTGTIEVRLNGNPTPIFTFTGNTRGSANSFLDQIRFYKNGYFSDIHVFDTTNPTGNDPHDFLGNKRLLTLAVSRDGSLGPNDDTAVPAKSAGSHFQNLDEFPSTEDTDYSALGAGQKATFGFQSVPGNTTGIVQVGLIPRWRIDDAQAHSARVNCLSAAAATNGPTRNPAASYVSDQSAYFPINPNGGGLWTPSGVNAMEGQIEVQS